MRGLSQTVAMGLDSDCTAASAGSILGAVLGKSAIAPELYECFHDRMDTYLKNTEAFSIRDKMCIRDRSRRCPFLEYGAL